jgi:hypothetical protein
VDRRNQRFRIRIVIAVLIPIGKGQSSISINHELAGQQERIVSHSSTLGSVLLDQLLKVAELWLGPAEEQPGTALQQAIRAVSSLVGIAHDGAGNGELLLVPRGPLRLTLANGYNVGSSID